MSHAFGSVVLLYYCDVYTYSMYCNNYSFLGWKRKNRIVNKKKSKVYKHTTTTTIVGKCQCCKGNKNKNVPHASSYLFLFTFFFRTEWRILIGMNNMFLN